MPPARASWSRRARCSSRPPAACTRSATPAPTAAEFILAFSHELPEDFGLRAAFGAMTPAVLGNTFDAPAAALAPLSAATREAGVPSIHATWRRRRRSSRRPGTPRRSSSASRRGCREIASPAGSAKQSKAALWPALEDLSMFSVRITDAGMREPHWHPETAEMGYVLEGAGRMTILDPDGSTDTYAIGPGDVYFIPRAYPHHIEDIGAGKLHILIFFDRATPGDIGFRTLVGAFARDTLAATFGIAEADLPAFPFAEEDPLIVGRVNPVDPTAGDPAAAEHAAALGRVEDAGLARRHALLGVEELDPRPVGALRMQTAPASAGGSSARGPRPPSRPAGAASKRAVAEPVHLVHRRPCGCASAARGPTTTRRALGVEPDHEERLAAADAEAAALADGVADDALVAAEHAAVEVDDLAGLGGAGPQLLDHRGIGAVRHEADVLAVGLVGHRQPVARRERPRLGLRAPGRRAGSAGSRAARGWWRTGSSSGRAPGRRRGAAPARARPSRRRT